jgi:hypothetical protein
LQDLFQPGIQRDDGQFPLAAAGALDDRAGQGDAYPRSALRTLKFRVAVPTGTAGLGRVLGLGMGLTVENG